MSFRGYSHACTRGETHQNQEILMVCLNQECESTRLCCLMCIDQLHRKHQLISLFKFFSMLTVLTEKSNPETQRVVCDMLTDFQTDIVKVATSRLPLFLRQEHRDKHQQGQEVIALAKGSVNLEVTSDQIQHVFQTLDNKKVCQYLQLVREAEAKALSDVESADASLKKAHLFIDKTINDTNNMMARGLEDVNGAFEKLKKMLDSQGRSFNSLVFSKQLKSLSVQVSEDQIYAKRIEGQGGYPIVLLDQPLTDLNCEFSATLKEQPGNKGCWLGVCVLNIVQGLQYKSCYGLGKGSWGIDQVGASHQSAYSWSHHDASYNSQPKVGFTFAIGEVVTVRVDFKKSTVIFEKPGNKYEMPIQTTLGEIYGYVGCTHIGDAWQLSS